MVSRSLLLEILTAEEKSRISDKVKNKGLESKIKYVVDPKIIGGIKIRIGTKVYDNTLKHKLQKLKETLDENNNPINSQL